MSSGLGAAISDGFSQILGSGTRAITPVITISGTDVSSQLLSQLMSVRLRQVYADQFDSVVIKLADPALLLTTTFKLQTGTTLGFGIKTQNWRFPGDSQLVNFGSFVIDEVQFLNPPGAAVIKATASVALGNAKWSNLTRTWGGTLLSIGQQIANESGLTLQGNPASVLTDLGNVPVAPNPQSNCSDLVYYSELCRRYYYSTKVHGSILWVFNEMSLDGQTPSFTIVKPTVGVIGGINNTLGLRDSAFTISQQNNNYVYADASGNYLNTKTGQLVTTKVKSETIDESAAGSNEQITNQPVGQKPPTVNAIRPYVIRPESND
jgi:phage protein D